jgi:hypothetical protein
MMEMSADTPGHPDPALTALASEVEHLRRTIERIGQTVDATARAAAEATGRSDALTAQLSVLAAQVAGLTTVGTQIAMLADRVTELAAGPAAGKPENGWPVSWFDLGGDTERAGAVLVDLAHWAYRVLFSYRAVQRQFSDCWHRHPAVVDALLALRASWQAAYAAGSGPAAAMDWQVRQLPAGGHLIGEELRGCSALDHLSNGNADQQGRGHVRVETDEDLLRAYAVRWALAEMQVHTQPPAPD